MRAARDLIRLDVGNLKLTVILGDNVKNYFSRFCLNRREDMLGAIIGDIVGSRFDWHNIKTKEFNF